ncbi:unnamed protein product, partial [Oncorhynchus mykiss]
LPLSFSLLLSSSSPLSSLSLSSLSPSPPPPLFLSLSLSSSLPSPLPPLFLSSFISPTSLSQIQSFREQLMEVAQKAHLKMPVPGKANGVLVLNQPLLIEAYVGLMSYIGNQNKLGYSLARGNVGF